MIPYIIDNKTLISVKDKDVFFLKKPIKMGNRDVVNRISTLDWCERQANSTTISWSRPITQTDIEIKAKRLENKFFPFMLVSGRYIAFTCPFKEPGAVLYVRESWKLVGDKYVYKADGLNNDIKWNSGTSMPKNIARTFLEVLNINTEKIDDIWYYVAQVKRCK